MLPGFLIGGFECSSHLRADGYRIDVTAATRHDELAADDYALLRRHGICTVRDGLRWHLIETSPGRYDWSNWLPQLRAARKGGTTVIWDLLHWGYPPDIDIWSSAFVDRFAAFAATAARIHANETDAAPWYVAINEMSFWSWAGGDTGGWPPFTHGRGYDLKVQLARAAIAATQAVRRVDRRARFATSEPLIRVCPRDRSPDAVFHAHGHTEAQHQAVDMLVGAREPELGGAPALVDLVGCNYYVNNQWEWAGATILPGQGHYTPLSVLLTEVYDRYRRPVFLSETGCEGSFRPAWLRYVADEVAVARQRGAEVEGICLYPILDHPGWEDERPCRNGLFDGIGDRAPFMPLLAEVATQRARFAPSSPWTAHSPSP